ncbi:MAG: hypothetical protein M1511_18595 [Deltaproteobacteria bacterium]|nr:hypothetical protein [Deltaproteobacteria bacterium]
MKEYVVTMEIAGPTAMWTRPDTGDAPVSYLKCTLLSRQKIDPLKVEKYHRLLSQ